MHYTTNKNTWCIFQYHTLKTTRTISLVKCLATKRVHDLSLYGRRYGRFDHVSGCISINTASLLKRKLNAFLWKNKIKWTEEKGYFISITLSERRFKFHELWEQWSNLYVWAGLADLWHQTETNFLLFSVTIIVRIFSRTKQHMWWTTKFIWTTYKDISKQSTRNLIWKTYLVWTSAFCARLIKTFSC